MHQHDGLPDVPVLNGAEPIGFPGGTAFDPGPDGWMTRMSARRVMTVSPPGWSSRASEAMNRRVVDSQST